MYLSKAVTSDTVPGVVMEEILPNVQAEVMTELQANIRKYCVARISASINALVPDSIAFSLFII